MGSDRDERRWIEKNNRVKRNESKKEEMKRMRKLVDNAYNSDTRIAKFMENDKQEKAAKKQAKQDAIRERKEAEEKVLRDAEEKIKKEKEDKEKVEKEALKKAMKNEKKIIKNRCKDTDYYSTDPDEKVQNLTDLDRLCEILNLDELKMLNGNMKDKSNEEAKIVFIKAVNDLNEKLEIENLEAIEKLTKVKNNSRLKKGNHLKNHNY